MERRVKGKKRTGKPRKWMICDLKQVFSKKKDERSDPEKRHNKRIKKIDGYVKMKGMAEVRERWRKWVSGTCPRAEREPMMMISYE